MQSTGMKKSPDRIRLRGLAFYGFHGVLPAEAELGQRFLVDVELRTSVKEAEVSDGIEDAIDYSAVYELVRTCVVDERYHLLEALAGRIAARILEGFLAVDSVEVEVHKPQAPLPGIFGDVSVSVERGREG